MSVSSVQCPCLYRRDAEGGRFVPPQKTAKRNTKRQQQSCSRARLLRRHRRSIERSCMLLDHHHNSTGWLLVGGGVLGGSGRCLGCCGGAGGVPAGMKRLGVPALPLLCAAVLAQWRTACTTLLPDGQTAQQLAMLTIWLPVCSRVAVATSQNFSLRTAGSRLQCGGLILRSRPASNVHKSKQQHSSTFINRSSSILPRRSEMLVPGGLCNPADVVHVAAGGAPLCVPLPPHCALPSCVPHKH